MLRRGEKQKSKSKPEIAEVAEGAEARWFRALA
jgi:hypothetical protein